MPATLEAVAAAALSRDPHLPALEYRDRWYSNGWVAAKAEAIGVLVRESGVAPGAAIGFVARNRPSAMAALLALIASGHTIQMIYPFQSPEGLVATIDRLKPAMVIADAEDLAEPVRIALQGHGIAAMAIGETDVASVAGCARSSCPIDPTVIGRTIEILTSGTTGPPKQYAVSFDRVLTHMIGGARTMVADVDPSAPPAILLFPVGNISGLYNALLPLLLGTRLVLIERFSVAEWHAYVKRHRPRRGGLPPAAIRMILAADVPPGDLASLEAIGTGSAPLDPAIQQAFEDRYGIALLVSYGATEFIGPVTAMTADLHATWGRCKLGSVGRAAEGQILRVIDPATGAILGANKEGLLEVLSNRVGPDWVRTADLVLIDEDGFLYHRGRADGAIMRGGFKLLPETIEAALERHPSVAIAAVVGILDPRLGQVPVAALQAEPGSERPGFEALEAHLRRHVLATHIPVAWRWLDALPRTPSLKVDRPAVARLFAGDRSRP